MKKLAAFLVSLCLATALAAPASALEYTISPPDAPAYGIPTSIEVVYTADGGAMRNEDLSKNAALIPPAFGSPSADAPGTSSYLTPNLAPGGMAVEIAASGQTVFFPPFSGDNAAFDAALSGYTAVTDDLYYSGGHLGTLEIPKLDLSVKIYQGTDSGSLARGAGHFEETSIWSGNIALAAHNRGTVSYFGRIHTLEPGDVLRLTTKLGVRSYEVVSVARVNEMDRSGLASSAENRLTLYTCVQNQQELRWCVQAVEIV